MKPALPDAGEVLALARLDLAAFAVAMSSGFELPPFLDGRVRAGIGARAFAALYQGRPAPEEGAIFR